MTEETNDQVVEQPPQQEAESQGMLDTSSELQSGEWLLMDGVKGTGDRPDFLLDKYSNMYEQAKAYPELQKKFGSFTGMPKDGYQIPEDFDQEDELVKQVIEWGSKNNLSQSGLDDLLTLASAQSSASEQVSREAEMAKLGDNAAQRIKQVEVFLQSKVADDYDDIKYLVKDADSVMLVEKLMKSIEPPKLPIDGLEVEGKPSWEDIEREMWRKDDNGNLLRSVSREHEQKIQRMMKEYGGDRPHHKVVGG